MQHKGRTKREQKRRLLAFFITFLWYTLDCFWREEKCPRANYLQDGFKFIGSVLDKCRDNQSLSYKGPEE